jgi:hypothetical protein
VDLLQATISKFADINMMVLITGRERTAKEYGELFSKAGLKMENVINTNSPYSILEAILE